MIVAEGYYCSDLHRRLLQHEFVLFFSVLSSILYNLLEEQSVHSIRIRSKIKYPR